MTTEIHSSSHLLHLLPAAVQMNVIGIVALAVSGDSQLHPTLLTAKSLAFLGRVLTRPVFAGGARFRRFRHFLGHGAHGCSSKRNACRSHTIQAKWSKWRANW